MLLFVFVNFLFRSLLKMLENPIKLQNQVKQKIEIFIYKHWMDRKGCTFSYPRIEGGSWLNKHYLKSFKIVDIIVLWNNIAWFHMIYSVQETNIWLIFNYNIALSDNSIKMSIFTWNLKCYNTCMICLLFSCTRRWSIYLIKK